MNRTPQRGNTEMWFLFSLVMAAISLFLFTYGEQDAPAEDLVALVSIAESTPEAKSRLREFLQATPRPNRKELRIFKDEINTLIVSNTVKSVTGVAPVASSRRTTWSEHPLAVFVFGNWKFFLGVGVFALILLSPITRFTMTMLLRDLARVVSKVRTKRV